MRASTIIAFATGFAAAIAVFSSAARSEPLPANWECSDGWRLNVSKRGKAVATNANENNKKTVMVRSSGDTEFLIWTGMPSDAVQCESSVAPCLEAGIDERGEFDLFAHIDGERLSCEAVK